MHDVDHLVYRLPVTDIGTFCNLKDQISGIYAIFFDQRQKLLCKCLNIAEMTWGNIERQCYLSCGLFSLLYHPLKCLLIYIEIQLFYFSAFFQHRNESVRCPDLPVASLPAYQYFCTGNFCFFPGDLGLKIELELMLLQCTLE